MEVQLREATEDDLDTIHSIEDSLYPSPWTNNFFRIIFHMNKELFLVAMSDDKIIGYTVGELEKLSKQQRPVQTGHLLNIAVKHEYQEKGVGTILLNELEQRFAKQGADIFFLEVRESNIKAQILYEHRGYEFVRKVKGYYGDEDGIVMSKRVTR